MSVIFDIQKVGTIAGYGSRNTPAYTYLERSDRKDAARVRNLTEKWLKNYPVAKREELIKRLRSHDDRAHKAAFFELSLHELFHSHNCSVEIHPSIVGTSRKPDFLITAPDGSKFYLEAALCVGQSQQELGQEKLREEVLDVIDKVPCKNFFIDVKMQGYPSQPIKLSHVRQNIENWLAQADYENIKSTKNFPVLNYEQHGAKFRFRLVPKNTPKEGRSIGVTMPEVKFSTAASDIRETLRKKAAAYGNLNLPYIIAANGLDAALDREDYFEALFGDQMIVIQKRDGQFYDSEELDGNGLFGTANNPKHTRVSGVLFTARLDAWAVAQRKFLFVHNPYAVKKLLDIHVPVEEIRVTENGVDKKPGVKNHQLFSLPVSWPEE